MHYIPPKRPTPGDSDFGPSPLREAFSVAITIGRLQTALNLPSIPWQKGKAVPLADFVALRQSFKAHERESGNGV